MIWRLLGFGFCFVFCFISCRQYRCSVFFLGASFSWFFFDYGHSLNRTPLNPVFLQIVSKETRERKEERVSRQRN
ncbi:hypothetical protein F5H01DRAFT_344476 [Linnemannia elongata]|nr:hypothetical protein F5H01DRAFT_344476 [Linnemannia elongata]